MRSFLQEINPIPLRRGEVGGEGRRAIVPLLMLHLLSEKYLALVRHGALV